MLKIISNIMLAAFFTLAFIGCNHYSAYQTNQPTELDQNWGRSYETAKYSQMLYPDAVPSSEPVVGLDANVADRVMKDYRIGKTPESATQLKGFQVGDK